MWVAVGRDVGVRLCEILCSSALRLAETSLVLHEVVSKPAVVTRSALHRLISYHSVCSGIEYVKASTSLAPKWGQGEGHAHSPQPP
jgi:hypothetical protein